jgi:adenosylcobinamide kinase / adenosylcobinamide-phosphate guanylyltransferase
MLTLILGGARSGKSRLAQRLAMPAARVTYVATARVDRDPEHDPEMTARIARHRASRPASWRTIEEPLALADALDGAAKDTDAIVVDCLTVWLSNLFWEHRDGRNILSAPSGRGSLAGGAGKVEDVARAELQRIAIAARDCHVILVSNELGSGTVPEPAITRAFRDSQGLLNQWAAEAADEVILTVAGLPLYLKGSPHLKLATSTNEKTN